MEWKIRGSKWTGENPERQRISGYSDLFVAAVEMVPS
jgi:hypothetical protein